MKNTIKTVCYIILTVTVVSSIATPADARNITLWGTQHRTSAIDPSETCKIQKELVTETVRNNPSAIDQHLSNFIYAVESSAHETSKQIVSTDDLNLKIYIGLYINAGMFINKMPIALKSQDDRMQVSNYLMTLMGSFYDFYYNDEIHGDTFVRLTTENILKRDKNLPYLQKISGDIDFINNNGSPKASVGPGAMQIIDAYSKGANFSDIEAQLNDVLQSYLALSKTIGQEFFDKRIKNNEKKYNITIDFPGSEFNGKPMFTIGSPDRLFTEQDMLSEFNPKTKHIQDLMFQTWREHFIVQNIIKLIKTKLNSNILIWFGEFHMPGVARLLMLSDKLTLDEKKAINVLTQSTTPTIACDANKVIDSMVQKEHQNDEEKPFQLRDWYTSYGLHDKSHKVTVYTLQGKKIYSDQNYSSSIAKLGVEASMIRQLQRLNSEIGTYYIRIQTMQNKDLDVYKIVYSE